MSGIKRKKCKHCRELFVPDYRNRNRQRYCSKPACQKASKAASQTKWLQKPENRDHFRGPINVQRVQQWREAHPGYWRRKVKTSADALQDACIAEPLENKENNSDFAVGALQDSFITQPAVLVGLIAQFTGCALQDDIAMAARRMQRLGSDILNPFPKGGRHGKTPHLPGAGTDNPQAVQLDRSSPGAAPAY
jgi:hypothetical protein